MDSQTLSVVALAWTIGIPVVGLMVQGLLSQNNEKLMARMEEMFARKDVIDDQITNLSGRVSRVEGKVWGERQ